MWGAAVYLHIYLRWRAGGRQAGRYPGGRKKDGRADECKQKERQERERGEETGCVCVERDIWGRLNNGFFLKPASSMTYMVSMSLSPSGSAAAAPGVRMSAEVVHLFVSVAECEITGRAKASADRAQARAMIGGSVDGVTCL